MKYLPLSFQCHQYVGHFKWFFQNAQYHGSVCVCILKSKILTDLLRWCVIAAFVVVSVVFIISSAIDISRLPMCKAWESLSIDSIGLIFFVFSSVKFTKCVIFTQKFNQIEGLTKDSANGKVCVAHTCALLYVEWMGHDWLVSKLSWNITLELVQNICQDCCKWAL